MNIILMLFGVAMGLSGSALALDLKKTKLPIEYECQMTHSAGIKLRGDGSWRSGEFEPNPIPLRILIERYADIRDKARKRVCEQNAELYGQRPASEGYCLTLSQSGLETNERIFPTYCRLTFFSEHLSGDNAGLECRFGLFIDTNRRILLVNSSFGPFSTGMDEPAVSLSKSDCARSYR
jgi:hypothetical protein